MKWLKSLAWAATLTSLVACNMGSNISAHPSPIAQAKVDACEKLVAWIIALDQSERTQVEHLGTIKGVQIQRSLYDSSKLSAIKIVWHAEWSDTVSSMWIQKDGIPQGFLDAIESLAVLALDPIGTESTRHPVPSCSMVNGRYSIDNWSYSNNTRASTLAARFERKSK